MIGSTIRCTEKQRASVRGLDILVRGRRIGRGRVGRTHQFLADIVDGNGIAAVTAPDHQRLVERHASQPGAELAGGPVAVQLGEGA